MYVNWMSGLVTLVDCTCISFLWMCGAPPISSTAANCCKKKRNKFITWYLEGDWNDPCGLSMGDRTLEICKKMSLNMYYLSSDRF